MSTRIERPEAAALAGGALVMLGACLPWLTLFAGMQQYSGLINTHGQILFAGGALAILSSVGIRRTDQRGMRWATVLLGLALLGVNLWLMSEPSPGLLVSSVGIALLILGPAAGLVFGSGHRKERI
jgi:peptidoglycan/LPS O-acetylase OafA/YrhL